MPTKEVSPTMAAVSSHFRCDVMTTRLRTALVFFLIHLSFSAFYRVHEHVHYVILQDHLINYSTGLLIQAAKKPKHKRAALEYRNTEVSVMDVHKYLVLFFCFLF